MGYNAEDYIYEIGCLFSVKKLNWTYVRNEFQQLLGICDWRRKSEGILREVNAQNGLWRLLSVADYYFSKHNEVNNLLSVQKLNWNEVDNFSAENQNKGDY